MAQRSEGGAWSPRKLFDRLLGRDEASDETGGVAEINQAERDAMAERIAIEQLARTGDTSTLPEGEKFVLDFKVPAEHFAERWSRLVGRARLRVERVLERRLADRVAFVHTEDGVVFVIQDPELTADECHQLGNNIVADILHELMGGEEVEILTFDHSADTEAAAIAAAEAAAEAEAEAARAPIAGAIEPEDPNFALGWDFSEGPEKHVDVPTAKDAGADGAADFGSTDERPTDDFGVASSTDRAEEVPAVPAADALADNDRPVPSAEDRPADAVGVASTGDRRDAAFVVPTSEDRPQDAQGVVQSGDRASQDSDTPIAEDRSSASYGIPTAGDRAAPESGVPGSGDRPTQDAEAPVAGDRADQSFGVASSDDRATAEFGVAVSGDRMTDSAAIPTAGDRAGQDFGVSRSEDRPTEAQAVPTSGDRAEGVSGVPTSQDRAEREYGVPTSQDRAEAEFGVPTSQDRAEAEFGVPTSQDRAEAEFGVPTSQDRAEREYDVPTSQDRAEREHGVPTSQDRAEREYDVPTSQDRAEREHGVPTSRDRAEREYDVPTSQDRAEREHGVPTSRDRAEREYDVPTSQDRAAQDATLHLVAKPADLSVESVSTRINGVPFSIRLRFGALLDGQSGVVTTYFGDVAERRPDNTETVFNHLLSLDLPAEHALAIDCMALNLANRQIPQIRAEGGRFLLGLPVAGSTLLRVKLRGHYLQQVADMPADQRKMMRPVVYGLIQTSTMQLRELMGWLRPIARPAMLCLPPEPELVNAAAAEGAYAVLLDSARWSKRLGDAVFRDRLTRILRLAHGARLRVGVFNPSSRDQISQALELGCDYVQIAALNAATDIPRRILKVDPKQFAARHRTPAAAATSSARDGSERAVEPVDG